MPPSMKTYLGLENVGLETMLSELLITEFVDNAVRPVLVELPTSGEEESYPLEFVEYEKLGWMLAGEVVVVRTGLRLSWLLIKGLVNNSVGEVLITVLISEGEET